MADLDHLHPEFRRRVQATGHAVYSGARSRKRQQELYEAWLRRDPGANPANPPGRSNHEYDETAPWPNVTADHAAGSAMTGGPWAVAVDFDGPPYPHGAAGLIFSIRDEPWHAQPVEIPESSRVAGMWQRLPAVGPIAPPPDPWVDLFVPILAS